MTTFAGLILDAETGRPGGGASFVLRAAPFESRAIEHDGWLVDVIKGTKIVVARGATPSTYDSAFVEGLEAANIGLDLMCFTASERLAIENYDDEHITWWPTSGRDGHVIALAAKHCSELGFSAVGVVTDAEGNLRPPAPPPPLTWHASYRYFRVSQTTTDLYDAYRNGFLALESLLDHLEPQKHNEREADWLARAMATAEARLPQATQLHPQAPDPTSAVVDEFYRQWRTALAHSKGSRQFVLPHQALDRVELTVSLERLTGYYVELAKAVFGHARAQSSFSQYVFRRMAKAIGEYEVFASGDSSPLDADDPPPAPSGGLLVPMLPVTGIEIPDPFVARRTWANPATDLSSLPVVRRIVGVKDSEVGFALVLQADLELASSDELQARFEFTTISRTELRTRFAT